MNLKNLYKIKPSTSGDMVIVFFMNTPSFIWLVRGLLIFFGFNDSALGGITNSQEPWVYMAAFPLTLTVCTIAMMFKNYDEKFKVLYGLPLSLFGIVLVAIHNSITVDVAATAQLMYVPFIMQASLFLMMEGALFVASAAIFANGLVLYLFDTPRQFTTDSFGTAVPMLMVAVVLVSMGQAEFLQTEAIKRLAFTDILTSLQNRTMLEETMVNIEKRLTPDMHVTLALMDIDHFKTINDTFGHHIGDKVLIDTAEAMRHTFDKGEVLIRMGGDELAVLFPQATADEALHKLNLFVRQLAAGGSTVHKPSLSIGVANYPQHVKSVNDLYAEADVALYQAKHNGRNQIVVASPTPAEPVKG